MENRKMNQKTKSIFVNKNYLKFVQYIALNNILLIIFLIYLLSKSKL